MRIAQLLRWSSHKSYASVAKQPVSLKCAEEDTSQSGGNTLVLAPYENRAALEVAKNLDRKVMKLLVEAAE
jgi:hypothetical protein